ncbi:cob(I)alamin adenosyltransferase [Diplonema papillatum]|nr:cob(I)alamin adenosyltransferase [Diplonema papillatum]
MPITDVEDLALPPCRTGAREKPSGRIATAADLKKQLPAYAQRGQLHKLALELGWDGYVDPLNGEVVATKAFLQQRPCCGERCRHCPHGHANVPPPGGDAESDASTSDAESVTSEPSSALNPAASSCGLLAAPGKRRKPAPLRQRASSFRSKHSNSSSCGAGLSSRSADSPREMAYECRPPLPLPNSQPLTLAEAFTDKELAQIPSYALKGRLHRRARELKLACYVDPATGVATFTADYLRKMKDCCGLQCQHCPHGNSKCKPDRADDLSSGSD